MAQACVESQLQRGKSFPRRAAGSQYMFKADTGLVFKLHIAVVVLWGIEECISYS